MRVYNGRAKHERKPYKKSLETRGIYGKEMKVMAAFWRSHTMDDIITKTPEELDIAIDAFIQNWQDLKIEKDPNWWYPEKNDTYRKTLDIKRIK